MSHSVSNELAKAKQGDQTALFELSRYFWDQLVIRARAKVNGHRVQIDEEQAVNDTLDYFFKHVQDDKFADVVNRGQLLAILSWVLARRVINQVNRQPMDNMQPPSSLIAAAPDTNAGPVDDVIASDYYEKFIASLSPKIRPVAELYLAGGYTFKDIADRLDVCEKTVSQRVRQLSRLVESQRLRMTHDGEASV
jgi:DNA-directed RNA polymerase specialized sigma24 family protein